jgi:hypothetical protein
MGSMCPTFDQKLILKAEGIHESEIENNKITANVSLKSIEAKCMNLSNLQQKGCPSSRIKGCPRYRVFWTCKIIGYWPFQVKSVQYKGVSRV